MPRIRLRRGTSTEWANANPILMSGEPGVDLSSKELKIGDGTTAWSLLPSIADSVYVKFKHSSAETVARTVQDFILENRVSVMDFNTTAHPVVGNGIADDTAAIQAIEASAFQEINLNGKVVKTTILTTAFTKRYVNGELWGVNNQGNAEKVKTYTIPLVYSDLSTKSPLLDWEDKSILWLGTSIPHQGGDVDSYGTLFARALGATCTNMAWSGSAVTYDVTDDPDDISTVKRLCMTEDDRLAGIAAHGTDSAYQTGFDAVTDAAKMTADYRIKAIFAAGQVDVVMLDHAHNDKKQAWGSGQFTNLTISTITKGATTTVTLSSGSVAVGNGVVLRVTGISKLDYCAARVQSVSGSTFTINVDSSGFAGTFSSGTAKVCDRATIHGGWEFILSYIRWCANLYGYPQPVIIMAGAPSEYTNDEFTNSITSVSTVLRKVADRWGLAYFDVASQFGIDEARQTVYMEDGVHPITKRSRQALANLWVAWASGGTVTPHHPGEFLPSVYRASYKRNHSPIYSDHTGGFSTPDRVITDDTSVKTDDFASGIGGWTSTGTAPTTESAPWGVGSALYLNSAADTSTYLSSNLTLGRAAYAEFDLWLTDVVGMTASGVKTVGVCHLRTNGAHTVLNLTVTQTGIVPTLTVFATPNNDISYALEVKPFAFAADTKYRIRLESVIGTSTEKGSCLLYIDDVLIERALTQDNTHGDFASVRLGMTTSNTGAAFPFYIGNVDIGSIGVHDFSTRYTGEFVSAGGDVLNIVNGIITGIAPWTPSRYFTSGVNGGWFEAGTSAQSVASVFFYPNKANADTDTTIYSDNFSSDAGGWSINGSGASYSIASGILSVVRGTTSTYVSRTLTTVPGAWYQVTIDMLSMDASGGGMRAGTTLGGTDLNFMSSTSTGTKELLFQATGTTTYLGIVNSSSVTSTVCTFDNLTVKKLRKCATQKTSANRPTKTTDGSGRAIIRHDTTDVLVAGFETQMASATVYHVTPSGITRTDAVNTGNAYSLPGTASSGTNDVYGWIVLPSAPTMELDTLIRAYLNGLAGL